MVINNSLIQEKVIRYYIKSQSISPNLNITVADFQYNLFDQELVTDIYIITKDSNNIDTLSYLSQVKIKVKALDFFKSNTLNIESIYINNPFIALKDKPQDRLSIINNLFNALSQIKHDIHFEHIKIDNLNILNEKVQCEFSDVFINTNYIHISSVKAHKDNSYFNASISTVDNTLLLSLNKLHVEKDDLNSRITLYDDIDLSSDIVICRDSLLLLNSELNYGSNYIRFNTKETSTKYVTNIYDTRFNLYHFLSLDSNRFNHLDNVLIDGSITSIKNDSSIVHGLIKSDLGIIDCNIIIPSLFNDNITALLDFKNFKIGKGLNLAESLEMNASVTMQYTQKLNSSIKISSHIKSVKLNNYDYNNLYFTFFNNNNFSSSSSINIACQDENFILDLHGSLNIDSTNFDISSGFIEGKVEYLDLNSLNFDINDSLQYLSSDFICDFNVNKKNISQINNVNMLFSNVNYHYLNTINSIGSVDINHLLTLNQDNVLSQLDIHSSIGTVQLQLHSEKGPLNFNIFNNNKLDQFNSFSIIMDCIDSKVFSDIFLNDILFEDKFRLESHYRKDVTPLYISMESSKSSYLNYNLNNSKIIFNGSNRDLNIISYNISDSNSMLIDSVHFNMNMSNMNSGRYNLHYVSSHESNFGIIKGDVNYTKSHYEFIIDDDSFLNIMNNYWQLDNMSNISISNKGLDIKNLALYLGDESILIDGFIRDKTNLDFTFKNFRLKNIQSFIHNQDISCDGLLNGQVLYNPFTFPVLSGNFKVDNFKLNNVLLGTLQLTNYSNLTSDSLYAIGGINHGNKEILSFTAQYPLNGSKHINADLLFENIPIKLLEPMINPVSNLQGFFKGNLNINGVVNDYKVNGVADTDGFQFLVPYLNMAYTNDLKIKFREDSIIIDPVKLKDLKNDTEGLFSAKLKHNALKNMEYRLSIESDSLYALNTSSVNNEDYYGKVFLDGNLLIEGDNQKTILNINGTTKKGTHLMIPLSKSKEISENKFVRFNTKKNINQTISNQLNVKPDFILNFNLDINNDSKFQLIFDEQIGDIIKGTGNGILSLKINESGEFTIFGDFEIEEGDYLFTLQDVITKSFSIENGGNVLFNGDPYEAIVDLNLLYNVQASLNPLNPDYNREVKSPVVCRMKMKDRLLLPNINFFIDVPNSDPIIDNSLQSMTNTDQKLLEQFLYLLIANSFLIQDDSNIDYIGSTLATTGTELLSNQLSNWLSQTTDAFDLGFKWIPGTGDSLSYQQVELAISKKLLDDRVTINGNVGTPPEQSQANIIGDLDIEYDFFKDGKLKLRVFNRSKDYDPLSENLGYEQGLGISFKKQFNNFNKLLFFRRKNR